jgi:hypothetical protein
LSSYTWICLIIAFLQLRSPPVLPSLHQLPHKLAKADGTTSDFADNLKKLKGYGNKNKSSEAELLFQFFRFYAHEFDYDKHVLSVRQGKLVTKTEKSWGYGMNNQLCVEEPFNVGRNLGNTADEYSFRGLHLELRRAFDLISVAKLEEACEQYVFPKEEERVWSRPAPQPRPVLLRSSSQSHSGRGGRGNHRGGRHNNTNNMHRGNTNRRASSSVPTYDPSMYMPAMSMPGDMGWYSNPQMHFQYSPEVVTQMAIAQAQENMRQLHLYAQQPAAYMTQHQNMTQQRVASQVPSGQQSTDRSRTSSFDNPPLSAPVRPDLYALYGINLAPQFYGQAGAAAYGTYPSTPATTATQEYRRPLQRSTITTDAGASTSSSSLRSHSQPASRSPSAQHSSTGYPMSAQHSANMPTLVPPQVNGVPIPSFMPDDMTFDETPKAIADSPLSDDSKATGRFSDRNASPTQLQQPVAPGLGSVIAFGDMTDNSGSGRRRLSSDQMPQSILDRRMKRTSRSPSPLGHMRASSNSTAPAPVNPASQRPLVVNGSGLKTSISASQRSPASQATSDELQGSGFDNPLQINPGLSVNGQPVNGAPKQRVPEPAAPAAAPMAAPLPAPAVGPPVVVNGSNVPMAPQPADDTSFRERIALMNSIYLNANMGQHEVVQNGMSRLSPSARQRLMARQPQNGVIAPLDLAIAEHRGDRSAMPDLAAHLSPVYETHTPSPTSLRRPDQDVRANDNKARENVKMADHKQGGVSQAAQETAKTSKVLKPAAPVAKSAPARENGHVRGAKSESDGGWQKAGKSKKKTVNGVVSQGPAEQQPKHDLDRKGG